MWPFSRRPAAPAPRRKPRIHFAADHNVYLDGTWVGVVVCHGKSGFGGPWYSRINGWERWHLTAEAARADACRELLRWAPRE